MKLSPIPIDLDQCRSADLMTCNPDKLVDLCDVHIDTSLPLPERMNDFLRQVRNPYLFKVDGLIIKAVYLPDAGRSFSDAVSALLAP